MKIFFCVLLLLSSSVGWSADVFKDPSFAHCSKEILTFLLKYSGASQELIKSNAWRSRFVVNSSLPLIDLHYLQVEKSPRSSIEMFESQSSITVSVRTENVEKAVVFDSQSCAAK
jgi:hypothetical protein